MHHFWGHVLRLYIARGPRKCIIFGALYCGFTLLGVPENASFLGLCIAALHCSGSPKMHHFWGCVLRLYIAWGPRKCIIFGVMYCRFTFAKNPSTRENVHANGGHMT